ncbi:TonB-dependent receptor [Kordiimonas laminariae]|uniref:TonB-dependent receptor n=1 Tax=Kordiimonas laminariae TaxID=2917717 RepID=UPI001FF474C8|nr:TonB-dependent receptor [Kordiimonas laminariae]MCK0067915.1 TonB-dependent receptor [Kordiimonas laminariae]
MRTFLLASASAIALASTPATAQESKPETAKDEIEIITVTAQFRAQSAIDVPLAVTAYNGDFLNQIGVDSFEELSAFTPGFVVQEQSVNNPGFVLRGITSDSGASNIEARVSVFQNNVSISRSRGSVVPLYDLERVEVLKGPQGTLFGRSAQIGAVHIITNKPEFEPSAGINATYGNFDTVGIDGFVNVPLSEKVAFRLAASYDYADGYTENTEGPALNGTDTFATRASLRFRPHEDFTLDLIANYSKDTPTGTSFKSGVIPAIGGNTSPNSPASLNTFGNFLGGTDISVDRELFDITAIVDWNFSDNWRLLSTTAYREFDSLEVFDPDGTGFDIFIFAEDAKGEQFSHDMRFSYDAGGSVRGFFGGGIFVEEGSQGVPLGIDIGTTAGLFGSVAATSDPVDGTAFFGGSIPLAQAYLSGNPEILNATLAAAGIPTGVFQQETFTNFADNVSLDVFAEVEVDLTERLTFIAGGRYSHDNKETSFSSAVEIPNPLTPLIVGTPALLAGNSNGVISSDDFDVDSTFGGFSWRAVLLYALSEDANIYFNYSRGRRPEVIEDSFTTNPDASVTPAFTLISEETVNSFELGAKGSFMDNRLTVEGALYYYDYKNFQTSVAVDAGPGQPPRFENVNGGTADSYGFEIGFDAKPTDNLNIFVTYAYNRGRFNETDDEGNAQVFGGNQFRLSPDHSFSAGFHYEHELDFGTFFLTPTYTWKSEVYFEDDNQDDFAVVDPASGSTLFVVPGTREDSFGLMNIRAGLRLMEGRLTIQGYMDNVFDKEYIIDGGNTGGSFGIPTFIAGPPRTYGLGLSYKF